ncbi:C-type lectin domain family 10 member A-like [Takifugu rubripes]|uniref:C-type lectin domain family 10 member A-like n=1 Tax=Takifugu rubripes TaxID=31033 RepID=UPI001145FAA6|nr:C-type lectin domain family 10 member A-like [Takifugu rubripes]
MDLRLSEEAFKSSCSQPQKELRFPGIDMATKYYETVYNYVCTDQKSLEFLGVCLKGMFLASILISDFTTLFWVSDYVITMRLQLYSTRLRSLWFEKSSLKPDDGILNICLRLTMRMPTAEDGSCETETKPCPQDWLAFACSCYYVSTQYKSWDESQRYCLQNDADLVVIGSIEEQKFLSGFIVYRAWVGVTDREEEGKWTWVDGTPVNTERELWFPGQPDDAFGGEDCGELLAQTQFIGLNDINCSHRIHWICEKLP